MPLSVEDRSYSSSGTGMLRGSLGLLFSYGVFALNCLASFLVTLDCRNVSS